MITSGPEWVSWTILHICYNSYNSHISSGLLEQMFAEHLGANTGPNLAMITQTRTIVDAHNAEFGENVGYMYGFPFLFFEQYLHSNRDLYLVVGLALGNYFTVNLLNFFFSSWTGICVVWMQWQFLGSAYFLNF